MNGEAKVLKLTVLWSLFASGDRMMGDISFPRLARICCRYSFNKLASDSPASKLKASIWQEKSPCSKLDLSSALSTTFCEHFITGSNPISWVEIKSNLFHKERNWTAFTSEGTSKVVKWTTLPSRPTSLTMKSEYLRKQRHHITERSKKIKQWQVKKNRNIKFSRR